MNLLTKDMMPELLSVNEGTCISLYMPTHRTHPDNLKIRYSFKNLLKTENNPSFKKHSESEATTLLEPFVALESDEEFWRHQMDWLFLVQLTCSKP
jgi:hypothetical protein